MKNIKVSCICVTKKRPELLTRSIKCFRGQDYINKEMVIVSVRDEVTDTFAKNHPDYRRVRVSEKSSSSGIYLRSLENVSQINQIVNGSMVYIENHKGQRASFPEEKLNWTEGGDSFIYERNERDGHTYLVTHKKKYISLSGENVVSLSVNPQAIKVFQSYTNEIKLGSLEAAIESSQLDDLKEDNWEIEVLNDVDSDVVFYDIQPQNEISLGKQRNIALKCASGDYICVWDDDDWYSSRRISCQMNALLFTNKKACTLSNQVLFDLNTDQAYLTFPRSEGCENSLLCQKDAMGFYDDLPRKEDTPVLLRLWEARLVTVIEAPYLYIYNVHKFNTCPSDHFLFILRTSTKVHNTGEVKRCLGT